MKEEIQIIKSILKNGSINIFGLPMSGKDTVGMRLAKEIGNGRRYLFLIRDKDSGEAWFVGLKNNDNRPEEQK